MTEKAIYIIGGIVLAVAYTALVFHLGSISGADSIQVQWDAENKKRDIASAKLKDKNSQLTLDNITLSAQIKENLEKSNEQLEKALAAVRAEYSDRLRQSTTRAGIYRKQAEGSTAERERLASHAAELDRSLEEGRAVVRELRETLGFRDEQLRQLGQQILADRALLN